MKFLHKIVKIMPQLRTDDERAKIVAITAIERVLNNEGLDWVDIASTLKQFLDKTIGADLDTKPIAASPPPRPAATWSTVQSAPIHSAPPPPPPRPQPPPSWTPPPPRPTPSWSQPASPQKFKRKKAPPPKATAADFT